MKAQRIHVLRLLAAASLLAASCVFMSRSVQAAPVTRDGSHDFDWEVGSWKTHLRVLKHNADGTTAWVTYEGTSEVVPIWSCRASMVELQVDGPRGQHLEAINLRLYNPQSHQWSLNFASAETGVMSVPTIGEYHDGIGEFYDQEPIDGREVLVRNIWSNIKKDAAHFEQAVSDDGGKTWLTNWIADDTRVEGTRDKCEKEG